MREGQRRVRSDKKKEVKATISIGLKDAIYRLSYITNTPVKDVCEFLVMEAMLERTVLENLSIYFIHPLKFEDTVFRGHLDNEPVDKRIRGERTGKVTITFTSHTYEDIYRLSYALAVSPSRTVALLLEQAILNIDIVNEYIKQHLKKQLSDYELGELKQLLRHINRNGSTHYSWASFLAHIQDTAGSPMRQLWEVVREFLGDKK